MDTKKDSDQKSTYSKAAYAWLMTVTSYYKRVSDLGINIDELMTLNTVAANSVSYTHLTLPTKASV